MLRPDDEFLSSDQQERIQLYRLMSVLGAVLIPAFSGLYAVSGIQTASPEWAHLALSGVFAGLFILSYVSGRVRRHYVGLMWGAMYLQMGWITVVATLNSFASEYGLALLLVYAAVAVVIELGARSMRPVLWFLGAGLVGTAAGLFYAPAPRLEPPVLLGIMAVVGLTVSFSLRGRLTIREQRDLLNRLVETSPGAIVRLDRDGKVLQASGRVEEVLRSDGEDLQGRDYQDLGARFITLEGERLTGEEVPFREVLKTGGRIHDAEFAIQWADRRQRFLSVSGAPLRMKGGKVSEAVFHLRDISDRVRREQALRAVKGRYQALVDNFPNGGVFLFDDDLRYILAGGQGLKRVGLSPSDVEGRRPQELFPDAIAQEHARHFRNALDGETHSYEQEYQGRYYQIRTLPVRGEEGDIICGLSVSQDITKRKRQEQRLRQSETLFQNVQDALFLLDVQDGAVGLSFEYRRVNPVYERKFGHAEDEIRGCSPREVYRSEVADYMVEKCERCVRQCTSLQYEETIPLDDTATFWKTRIAPVVVEGEVRQIVGIARDVTEQHWRQVELERQNDLFDRAQKIADVGAWEYDVVADEGNWTKKAYEILGVPLDEEPDPRKAIQYYHPEDQPRVQAALEGALEDGESSDLEVRVGTGDDMRWARIRGEPQRENGRVVRVRGTIQDITERKERERALREAKREAEEASRLKSALLANMSHEIRTPLTSIIGFAEATNAEMQHFDLPEGSPLSKYTELIERSGRRLLETLEGVLTLSKLEAGEMKLRAEPIDLATEAQAVIEELRSWAKKKGVSLRQETDPVWAVADEGGVQIVARNLLSNAIKYTDEGGDVCIRTYREDASVAFEVEDTGIGMDPDAAQGLFEPFRQASEGLAREYQGTGIGLALTKEATEQMGGSIEVETEEGVGTRIVVRLPRAEEKDIPDRPAEGATS